MKLTKEYIRHLFNYFPNEGILYWRVSRGKALAGNVAGCIDEGTQRVIIDKKKYNLSKIIYLGYHGYMPNFIAYKNGNKFDNRIDNLIDADLKEAPQELSQEYVRKVFSYDPATGNLYWKVKISHCCDMIKPVGWSKTQDKLSVTIDGKDYLVHRIIFLWWHGWLPEVIDHIDNIGTNNRISNLRPATPSQNGCNTNVRSDNKLGVKGVSWNKQLNKFHAQVQINYTNVLNEHFDTLEEAEKAVREARERYHGEFCRHK